MKNSTTLWLLVLLASAAFLSFSLPRKGKEESRGVSNRETFVSLGEEGRGGLLEAYRLLLDGEPLLLPTEQNAASLNQVEGKLRHVQWQLFKDPGNLKLNLLPLRLGEVPRLRKGSIASPTAILFAYRPEAPVHFKQARRKLPAAPPPMGQIEIFRHGSEKLVLREALDSHYFKDESFYKELTSPSEFKIYINKSGLISFPLRSKKSGMASLDSSLRHYIVIKGNTWGLPPGYYRVVIGA